MATKAKSGKAASKVERPKRRFALHRLLPDPRVDLRSRWTKSRPELSHLTEAQMVMDLMASDAFQKTVQPLLDRVEEERAFSQRRKREFPYTVTEVERAMVFKAVAGINLIKELRDTLSGDDGELRATLGFDKPRNPDRPMKRMDGVPSEATLCRHRKLFDRGERAHAYKRCFELMRDQHFIEFPVEMLDEIRQLAGDGSKIEVEGVCPIYDKKTKEILNAKSVTCPDGGYVGKGSSPDHSGHGFNKHTIATATKLPLVFEVGPLPLPSEIRTCEVLLERLGEDVLSKLPVRGLGVFSADGVYSGNGVRAGVRRLGMIENIHKASHADTPEVAARVAKLRKERIKIQGKPNWFSDGLYQLVCKCEQGTLRPGYDFDKDGGVSTWTEGTCVNCGPITITSGRWRIEKSWVRVDPSNPDDEPQLAFGNPLTYDSLVSRAYGNQRRSRQEGLNSVMATRMGLTTGKRRYKTIEDARADVAIAYALSHMLTMMQRRASRPSELPLAA
jgi:hypothetical protein